MYHWIWIELAGLALWQAMPRKLTLELPGHGALNSLIVVAFVLSACASPGPAPKSESVPPGNLYAGGYINVRSPSSQGWRLLESSASGMAFAKTGNAADESFAAQVSMFGLPQTRTPEEFEALIKAGIEKGTDSSRFKVRHVAYEYSRERGYPCVRYRSVAEDTSPQTSQDTKRSLLLELEALYCRHPVHPETGFAASYSHRGDRLYPNLRSEAQEFIEGVQVPAK